MNEQKKKPLRRTTMWAIVNNDTGWPVSGVLSFLRRDAWEAFAEILYGDRKRALEPRTRAHYRAEKVVVSAVGSAR